MEEVVYLLRLRLGHSDRHQVVLRISSFVCLAFPDTKERHCYLGLLDRNLKKKQLMSRKFEKIDFNRQ